MKYLVVRAPGGESPILFPRAFMHRWVAGLLDPMDVVSAGFVRSGQDGPECYGSSSGLGIASRPEADTELVRRSLAEGGAQPLT